MVSWNQAVDNAIPPEARKAYIQAVAQVHELNRLVQDFARVVQQAGKWPTTTKSEYDNTRVPTKINSRISSERHVWVDVDSSWGAVDFMDKRLESIFIYRATGNVEIGFLCRTMLDTTSHRNFPKLCVAVNDAMDWVPRELVNYLRNNNLRVPGQ